MLSTFTFAEFLGASCLAQGRREIRKERKPCRGPASLPIFGEHQIADRFFEAYGTDGCRKGSPSCDSDHESARFS